MQLTGREIRNVSRVGSVDTSTTIPIKAALSTQSRGRKVTSHPTFKTAEQARAVIKPILDQYDRLVVEYFGQRPKEDWRQRLSGWFGWMEQGWKVDERTPLFRGVPRRTVMDQFSPKVVIAAKRLAELTNGEIATCWITVEKEQAAKAGPFSKFRPWSQDGDDKVKAVMSDKPPLSRLKVPAWRAALRDVTNLIAPGSIAPVDLKTAIGGRHGKPNSKMDVSTNAGFPTQQRRWWRSEDEDWNGSKAGLATDAERIIISQVLGVRESYSNKGVTYKSRPLRFVALTSQRTNMPKGPDPLSNPKSKRAVLAMPKYETILGRMFMVPIQEKLALVRNSTSNVRLIPAWSPMPVLDKNMQVFLRYAEDHRRNVLSGDISNFDASLPPWAMWDIAQAMAEWIKKDDRNLFLAILHGDIFGTEVLTPTKYFEACPSSVKSGSIFTSLIGCIANYAIQRYGMHAKYYSIDQQCVMGDDFIIDGDGVIPESISEAFADFGMVCSAEKQYFHRYSLHFLQRLHILGLPGGQASICRVLGTSLAVEDDTQLEYDERNRYAYELQALARIENANLSPGYSELVEYEMSGDKYQLGKDVAPSEIVAKSGDFGRRKLLEAYTKPWKSTGLGVPFEHWSVNRVVRGEKVPPLGVARFKFAYGVDYDKVAI